MNLVNTYECGRKTVKVYTMPNGTQRTFYTEKKKACLKHRLEKKRNIIVCPNCASRQNANIEYGLPFAVKIHHCTKCSYIITESEWNEYPVPALANEKLPTSLIIFSLPENMALVKDSGLWALHNDNSNEIIAKQGVRESERRFIRSLLLVLKNDNDFTTNLSVNEWDFIHGKQF